MTGANRCWNNSCNLHLKRVNVFSALQSKVLNFLWQLWNRSLKNYVHTVLAAANRLAPLFSGKALPPLEDYFENIVADLEGCKGQLALRATLLHPSLQEKSVAPTSLIESTDLEEERVSVFAWTCLRQFCWFKCTDRQFRSQILPLIVAKDPMADYYGLWAKLKHTWLRCYCELALWP